MIENKEKCCKNTLMDKYWKRRLDDNKHVEFYSQSMNAWYKSAISKDVLMFISSILFIAILFLSSIFSYLYEYSPIVKGLFLSSFVAFSFCIASVLVILKENQFYIQSLTDGDIIKQETHEFKLSMYDISAKTWFYGGILFLYIIFALSIFN